MLQCYHARVFITVSFSEVDIWNIVDKFQFHLFIICECTECRFVNNWAVFMLQYISNTASDLKFNFCSIQNMSINYSCAFWQTIFIYCILQFCCISMLSIYDFKQAVKAYRVYKNTDTKNIIRLKISKRFQMVCSYMPLHYVVIPCWMLQMCLLEREFHWICYQQGHCDMLHGEWCPWVVIDTWWFN